MDCIEHSSEAGSGEYSGQLVENGGFYRDGRCYKQASPPRCGGGSRNTSPISYVSSRNTNLSRQKVVKTKPRSVGSGLRTCRRRQCRSHYV
ncbi:hypothetical protein AHAS_Ahas16G0217800 [Arachis hypogaea]